MAADERVEAAEHGQLSLGEMVEWARRCADEVPIVNRRVLLHHPRGGVARRACLAHRPAQPGHDDSGVP